MEKFTRISLEDNYGHTPNPNRPARAGGSARRTDSSGHFACA
jgi:hypothetical protein